MADAPSCVHRQAHFIVDPHIIPQWSYQDVTTVIITSLLIRLEENHEKDNITNLVQQEYKLNIFSTIFLHHLLFESGLVIIL